MEVIPITKESLGPYLRHLQRHVAESGSHGLPVFYPFEPGHRPRLEVLTHGRAPGIERPVSEPGWWRMWGVLEGSELVGNVELAGGSLASELHRAMLMLGLERTHYGRGLAGRLLDTAVGWAREQPTLEWIDLAVFADNAPALALYEKAGFERIGETADRYRIAGRGIDEVLMTLRIGR